jgi:hypothetical protein
MNTESTARRPLAAALPNGRRGIFGALPPLYSPKCLEVGSAEVERLRRVDALVLRPELRSLPIVVGVGVASEGQLAHRAALALAEQLGKEPTVFPGGHSGIGSHPEAFAGCLHEVLRTYN